MTIIPLDDASKGGKDFDCGVARKFVIDPHHHLLSQSIFASFPAQ